MKKKITKVKYDNSDHEITAVQFEDGSTASINDAIKMARQGEISGVNVDRARESWETLRSYPDGDSANNLVELPRF